MILRFNAQIIIDAKEKSKSIFQAINTDNMCYPDNPTNTKISFNDVISICIEAKQLSHLRANLNSTLRLIQASFNSIQ